MLAGVIAMALYFEYLLIFKHQMRIDLLVFLAIMAAAKVLAMLYHKKFN